VVISGRRRHGQPETDQPSPATSPTVCLLAGYDGLPIGRV
jgi:hypothetical protein